MLPFHPYADLFPLIEGEHFDAFVADVKANDVREKIVVWDGAILDGRNRYRAGLAAGLIEEDDGPDRTKYFVRFVPAVDGDPLTFVISKNLNRRHLTDGQRASVAAKIATLGRGRPGAENPPSGGISERAAAAMLNVAERQLQRARVVHERGAEEVRRALDDGALPVATAERIARLSQDEQRREVGRLLPNGARAIMGSRVEPADSADFFPTPPWATRALIERALPQLGRKGDIGRQTAWEPACGEGHIAEVLGEYFKEVIATDLHEYGYGHAGFDFTQPNNLITNAADWIITNPPFGDLTEQFVLRALDLARTGVAMFVRLQWLESVGRYESVFRDHPPTMIAFFAERVPLCKGRWEPEGTTATAYIWLVWVKGASPRAPFWIPPGCRESLTRPDDAERFTAHPVVKREAPVDGAGEPIEHNPSTGEIIEDAKPEASPPAVIEVVSEDRPSPATPIDDPDDTLEIPAFLRQPRVPAEAQNGR